MTRVGGANGTSGTRVSGGIVLEEVGGGLSLIQLV